MTIVTPTIVPRTSATEHAARPSATSCSRRASHLSALGYRDGRSTNNSRTASSSRPRIGRIPKRKRGDREVVTCSVLHLVVAPASEPHVSRMDERRRVVLDSMADWAWLATLNGPGTKRKNLPTAPRQCMPARHLTTVSDVPQRFRRHPRSRPLEAPRIQAHTFRTHGRRQAERYAPCSHRRARGL